MGERAETEVNVKKRRSLCKKGVIGLYVCAGLSLVCTLYMLYYSITYVSSYYAGYGMSISEGIKDVVQYVISSTGNYLGFAILFLAAAVILNKVDALGIKPEATEQIELKKAFESQLLGDAPEEKTEDTEQEPLEDPQQEAGPETQECEAEPDTPEEPASEEISEEDVSKFPENKENQ